MENMESYCKFNSVPDLIISASYYYIWWYYHFCLQVRHNRFRTSRWDGGGEYNLRGLNIYTYVYIYMIYIYIHYRESHYGDKWSRGASYTVMMIFLFWIRTQCVFVLTNSAYVALLCFDVLIINWQLCMLISTQVCLLTMILKLEIFWIWINWTLALKIVISVVDIVWNFILFHLTIHYWIWYTGHIFA